MDDELHPSEADYANLPDEPERRFVALEKQVRAEMNRLIAQQSSTWSDLHLRRQYASLVSGYAEALGIEGVAWQNVPENDEDAQAFLFNASRAAAKISAMTLDTKKSVQLGQGSRKEIEVQIANLKHMIEAHVSDKRHRDALIRHLEELRKELGSERVDLAKIMLVLGRVAFALTTGTTFLAEAPHAIATISGILGRDKVVEEAWHSHIGPPPKQKAFPTPERKGPVQPRISLADEEVPF